MARFDLKIVEFSVLSLVGRNPGITSRQLCQQLDMLPPNMVGMIDALARRGFLERRPHPRDGRATGLYLTAAGRELVDTAEPQLKSSEEKAVAHLSEAEQAQLMQLLQKLYR
jgi:DNA-binding MarR family transcriptional regulator